MTYPEQVCFDWLTKNQIKFESQFRYESWYIDFKVDKILIEIDGAYWHDASKDKIRDTVLEKAGFSVIRILANSRIEEKLEEVLILSRKIYAC